MPVKKKPMPSKTKYFTPEQANATLPLVRAIIRDVTELAHDLRDRHERMTRLRPKDKDVLSDAHREEIDQARTEIERGKAKMAEYEKELTELGVELKDYFTGLIDFPCWMDGREVCLCWRHGEADVAHWHEVDAGFAGRKKLNVDATV
jgi:hypothetical protein